jgi:secondary thiamine-phosphate synthase enzyme
MITLDTTRNQEFIEITREVQKVVSASGMRDGLCHVFSRHTTAGITVNERADPDVRRDMLMALELVFPANLDYRHAEGNSPAHLKATLLGSSCTVPVRDGQLSLGTWQGIFFGEFDGPRRNRAIEVTLIPG